MSILTRKYNAKIKEKYTLNESKKLIPHNKTEFDIGKYLSGISAGKLPKGQMNINLDIDDEMDEEVHPNDCDHSDCDDYCCLICGQEMTETWSSLAYDYYKD